VTCGGGGSGAEAKEAVDDDDREIRAHRNNGTSSKAVANTKPGLGGDSGRDGVTGHSEKPSNSTRVSRVSTGDAAGADKGHVPGLACSSDTPMNAPRPQPKERHAQVQKPMCYAPPFCFCGLSASACLCRAAAEHRCASRAWRPKTLPQTVARLWGGWRAPAPSVPGPDSLTP